MTLLAVGCLAGSGQQHLGWVGPGHVEVQNKHKEMSITVNSLLKP